jgi:hypothetical protein
MTGGFQATGQLTWFIFRCYGFIIARMHARTAAFSCWGAGSSASLDIWQRVSAVGNPSRQRTSKQATEKTTQR